MSFKNLALPLATLNVPIIRLQPKSKIPMDPKWQNLATTDFDKILAWDKETPNANCACVAKPDGVLFFETDEPGVVERYEQETGEKLPKTYTVQSREGRYHFYFLQTDESRKCGSITQKEIPFGSLRQNNAYVVAPGSIHPTTGLPYTTIDESPIVPIPTRLIEWLVAQKTKIEKANPSAQDDSPIPDGQRDDVLTSIAGKWREAGLEYEEIYPALSRVNQTRCKPPKDEEDIVRIAKSVCRYPKGVAGPTVLIEGKLPGQNVVHPKQAAAQEAVEVVPDSVLKNPRPVITSSAQYPLWAWEGTLYQEFAELCGKGNHIPHEFFIESIKTVVGAICGHRIQPDGFNNQQPSRFYTILVGPGGGGKSSATKWAINLFLGTGLVYELSQTGANLNIGCAKGSFASDSGMQKHGFIKHSRILQVYDEVTSVIEKFSITGSGGSFLNANNELYEYCPSIPLMITKAGADGSRVGEVHNSILGCTTPLRWQNAFKKTNTDSSGFFQRLNIIANQNKDRVAELLTPDFNDIRERFIRKIEALEYQKVVMFKDPEATALFDSWYKSKEEEWGKLTEDITGRIQVLVQRNACHLAWLMSGEDVVPAPEKAAIPIEINCDVDIMRRAIAIAEYEVKVRQLHKPIEADNPYAQIENAIERYFVDNGGQPISRRHLYRTLNANRHGTQIFDKCISNLVQEGLMKIGVLEGAAKKGRKSQVLMWIGEGGD